MDRKKVRRKLSPPPGKIPRVSPAIENLMDQNPVWHIGSLDVDGPWGWAKIDSELFFNQILPKIKDFEAMFWKEIMRRGSHAVSVSKIITDAQKRLARLNLDDNELLISLRLTSKQRIWGIRIANILRILWWDPNHEICPSILKHT